MGKKETQSLRTVSSQVSREIRQVGDNLKRPLTELVTGAVESSFDVAETVTAGVGQLLGAVVDEGSRLTDKLRRGLDSIAD